LPPIPEAMISIQALHSAEAASLDFGDTTLLRSAPADELDRFSGLSRRKPMNQLALILVALVSGLAAAVARAGDVALESVPPVVVKTVPEAGTGNVDPKLAEIQVTFSKEMQDGTWSWSTLSQESFPKVEGKPKYLADKRTCVLPVKLEPGKTYAIWVNSDGF